MGELAKWRRERWVRIGTDGKIKGECGTSKNKRIQTDAYPLRKPDISKAKASTARKKKSEGSKGKQFVSNTKAAKVKRSGLRVKKVIFSPEAISN